jgi:hypothetical protein
MIFICHIHKPPSFAIYFSNNIPETLDKYDKRFEIGSPFAFHCLLMMKKSDDQVTHMPFFSENKPLQRL